MKGRLSTFLDHMYSYLLLEDLLVLEGFFRRMFDCWSQNVLVIIPKEQNTFFIFLQEISLHEFRHLIKCTFRLSLKQNVFFKNVHNKIAEIESIQELHVLRNLLKDQIRTPTTK